MLLKIKTFHELCLKTLLQKHLPVLQTVNTSMMWKQYFVPCHICDTELPWNNMQIKRKISKLRENNINYIFLPANLNNQYQILEWK